MREGDGLPTGLQFQLKQVLLAKNRSTNLIGYGCVPEWVRLPTHAEEPLDGTVHRGG
jgi:hypothetical protein